MPKPGFSSLTVPDEEYNAYERKAKAMSKQLKRRVSIAELIAVRVLGRRLRW